MKHITLIVLALLAAPFAFGLDTDNDGLPDATDPYPYVPVNNMALGANHTCVLVGGKITCWGSDLFGQTDVPKTLVDPVQVVAGDQNTCALDTFYVTCWGIDGYDIFPVRKGKYVDTKGTHVCVIDADGVSCFRGNDRYGQLEVPAGLKNPRQVVTGLTHTCALDDNGVHCWGSDTYGESDVPHLDHPTMITAAANDTCALDDGRVVCWGANNYGQLNVPSMVDVKLVSAGFDTICALDRFGVECWGRDSWHQADVPSLIDPVYVMPGTHHTCVLESQGPLCWGYDAQGQTNVPQALEDDWTALSRSTNAANTPVMAPAPVTQQPPALTPTRQSVPAASYTKTTIATTPAATPGASPSAPGGVAPYPGQLLTDFARSFSFRTYLGGFFPVFRPATLSYSLPAAPVAGPTPKPLAPATTTAAPSRSTTTVADTPAIKKVLAVPVSRSMTSIVPAEPTPVFRPTINVFGHKVRINVGRLSLR